ncbi:CBS domain-containing protein [Salinigranum rubrum]|nr:CBS domain-containing protein [Salinigranum rubrum]
MVTQEYETAEPETRVGAVRSELETATTEAVLVVDEDVTGAVLPRDLLRSRLSDDAEVQSIQRRVPAVDSETGVREVARLLVENETTIAPVFDGEAFRGVVTRDSLLRAVSDSLSAIDVADVYTTEPATVDRKTAMGELVNDLRENDLTRLPVLDDGDLVGVATTDDLVEFVVRSAQAPSAGDRGGEKADLLELPVENVMSRPAETTTPTRTVQSAVERMLETGYDGLAVVTDDTHGDLIGVISKTDVLQALVVAESERLDVQVTNPEYLRTEEREEVPRRIEAIVEKDQKLDVIDAQVDFQKHDEELRGQSLFRCQIRLFTDEDQVAGTGEGYGAADALSTALETLERNVLDLKNQRTAEKPHGQVPQEPSDR